MPGLEVALSGVIDDFDSLLADIPNMRRELHTELSEVLKSELDSSISSSLNDSHGTIRGWQKETVGSGGGYAAIRAMKGQSGKNSPGAITNYLENGHKIPPRRSVDGSSGRKYRPRINTAYVSGRHFYASTGAVIEGKLISASETYCGKLAARLEGSRQ